MYLSLIIISIKTNKFKLQNKINKLKQTSNSQQMNSSIPHPHTFKIQSSPYKQVTSHYINPTQTQHGVTFPPQAFPETVNIRQGDEMAVYRQKLKLSGYIIGEPVTFTDRPSLPQQYKQFSPGKDNITGPVFIQANSITHSPPSYYNIAASPPRSVNRDYVVESRNRPISMTPPHITITSKPLPDMINRQQHDRLVIDNKYLKQQNSRLVEENRRLKLANIGTKSVQINQLQNNKITELQREVTRLNWELKQRCTLPHVADMPTQGAFSQVNMEQMQYVFGQCLEKYRQSILQQQRLLIDRFRLECKNEQLNYKKFQLLQSRKQQTQQQSSFARSKQYGSSLKESKKLVSTYDRQPRHWKKSERG